MNRTILQTLCFLLGILLLITACQPIQRPPAAASASAVEAKIQDTMRAAPASIAKEATILDWPTVENKEMWPTMEGSDMVVIREGSNGWFCYTDWPVTPGAPDPACYDAVWMQWNEALVKGEAPQIDTVGIGYMLAGGVDPSNTDPFAMAPAPGEDWTITPPHLMLLVPGGFAAADFSTDPTSGYPYIMYDDTPYEHLMMPVQTDEFQEADAKMRNAMSAAPLAVAQDATILDWPANAGDEMVVLREGSNNWFCFTDWPATPGDDPSCNDPVFMAWNDAYAKGEPPQITTAGIGYMLIGGSDASNTEPFAMEPTPGEDWVTSPPHVMLVVPGDLDPAHFSTDPNAGEPYIMFEGTPYEHLMIPVAQ